MWPDVVVEEAVQIDNEQVRKSYDQSIQWMEKKKPEDEVLRRFLQEAAAT